MDKIDQGDRRIQVLLDSGRAMNPTKPIPPKEIPMEDLKAGQNLTEDEQGGEMGGSETAGSSTSNDLGEHPLPGNILTNEELSHTNEDEIIASPIQERAGRDIHFAELPRPQNDREQNESTILKSHALI